jgi:hypothetical protein
MAGKIKAAQKMYLLFLAIASLAIEFFMVHGGPGAHD